MRTLVVSPRWIPGLAALAAGGAAAILATALMLVWLQSFSAWVPCYAFGAGVLASVIVLVPAHALLARARHATQPGVLAMAAVGALIGGLAFAWLPGAGWGCLVMAALGAGVGASFEGAERALQAPLPA